MGSKSKSTKDDDDILDDVDVWDEDTGDDELELKPRGPVIQQRGWRDLERFKEERELKKLLEGTDWLDDL